HRPCTTRLSNAQLTNHRLTFFNRIPRTKLSAALTSPRDDDSVLVGRCSQTWTRFVLFQAAFDRMRRGRGTNSCSCCKSDSGQTNDDNQRSDSQAAHGCLRIEILCPIPEAGIKIQMILHGIIASSSQE